MLGDVGIVFAIVMGSLGFAFSVFQYFNYKKEARKVVLLQSIMDKSLSRSIREPFYVEYLKLGGNGPVMNFWAREEEEKRALEKGV